MSAFLRRAAKRIAYPAAEQAWAAMLRAARPAMAPGQAMRPWQPGSGPVVVVAPHPDDETLGAGGVIALHAQAGDAVAVIALTDGRASRGPDGAWAGDAMAAQRRAELEAALVALAGQPCGADRPVTLAWLGLREGQWTPDEARTLLAPLLSQARIVYAPSCVDFHPEHLAAGRLVAELVTPPQIVRIVELGVPLTPLLANLAADISAVAAQRRRALACFTTQKGALVPLQRGEGYRAALYGLPQVEVFWELSAPAYAAVMRAGAWSWQGSPFRGIRPRPFSDGLAFGAWRARRRLARVAAAASAPGEALAQGVPA